MLSTPEGRAELVRQDGCSASDLRRQIGMTPGPEQRAERQRLVRAWRARRMAGIPLSPEELALRQERQQWREARRARWQIGADEDGPPFPPRTEGPSSSR